MLFVLRYWQFFFLLLQQNNKRLFKFKWRQRHQRKQQPNMKSAHIKKASGKVLWFEFSRFCLVFSSVAGVSVCVAVCKSILLENTKRQNFSIYKHKRGGKQWGENEMKMQNISISLQRLQCIGVTYLMSKVC